MNVNALFTVPGHLLSAGMLLLLWLCCMTAAAAESSFSGASPVGGSGYFPPSLSEEKNELTLRNAALLALQHNPELAAFAKETRALQGVTLQAGLLPNPDLVIMAENAGNLQKVNNNPATVGAKEVEQQDTTIRIQQLIELGGKRAARVKAASLGEELADQAYENRRVELVAQVANVFTEVLAGQERLRLAEENVQLAQKMVNAVSKRVQAGKVPPIEETKVGVALSTTRIELEQARRDLAAARKRLALLWGNSSPLFNKALGDLSSLVALPSFEVLAERVLASPMAQRAIKNTEQRRAMLELEQTRRIPNLTFIAGVLNHSQTGGTTAVAGISMPLQLFDRNQGNLREAYQRVDKAMDEQAATDLRLKTELMQAYESLSSAQNEIKILRVEVLPAARSAFEVTNRGYELGKFGFLEVLDAQRTLFQNEVLYVRALANYQRLVNEIERLIAAPIEGISDSVTDAVGAARRLMSSGRIRAQGAGYE